MKLHGLHRTLTLTAAAAAVCVLTPTAFSQGIGELNLDDLMTSTPQKLERGSKIWAQNCVSCHGTTGAGDGPSASYFPNGVSNLATGAYRHGGGPLQLHNTISRGDNGHPLFEHLPYQDLWAVTHFARSLGPASTVADPPEVLKQAKFEAREGVCNPAVKSGIDGKMKFLGDAQLKQAEAVYASNCSSCHGAEGKGDGSGAAALKPAPRNFTSGDGWTNGTSALAVFNTLANGIEGTSMAAFKHLSESDRWALTHLVREKWLPAAARAEATPEQVDAVCRSLSGGGSLATIAIDDAMKLVAADVVEHRIIRMKQYGTAWVEAGTNTTRGQRVFEQNCQSCHGPRGVGSTMGPYGAHPPYLVVKVNRLDPGLAGGTFKEFALRSIGGAHTAIPDATGASHISENDWRSLHAYVTSFEGDGDVRPAAEKPTIQPTLAPLETPTDVVPAPTGATPPTPAMAPKAAAKKPAAAPVAAPVEKPAAAANE